MKIYGLRNCDSCRKAVNALPMATLVDVRLDGMPEEVLEQALARFGVALLNTRSTTWRGLSETERLSKPLSLLKAHPAVMKRPLIVADGQMYLGWAKDVQAALETA